MANQFIGQTFGRLSVVQRDYQRGDCHYLCKCECGNIKPIRGPNLHSGRVKSCGCLHKENLSRRSKERGKAISGSYFDSLGEVPRRILLILSQNPSGTLTSQIGCGTTKRRHLYKLEAHEAIYRVPDGCSFRWSLTQKGWDKVFSQFEATGNHELRESHVPISSAKFRNISSNVKCLKDGGDES